MIQTYCKQRTQEQKEIQTTYEGSLVTITILVLHEQVGLLKPLKQVFTQRLINKGFYQTV